MTLNIIATPMSNTLAVQFIRRHPLAFVIVIAALLRLPAVIYSKGFMASDDHYETVEVSYGWLHASPLDDHGHLQWKGQPGGEIARFPLYTLSLYVIMKGFQCVGVTSLDTMMYGVRAVHALLSLLVVWALFKSTLLVTKSTRWAVVAGLVGAAHFAMPYLSVRTLIEVVSGELWIVGIYLLYRYFDSKDTRWLVAAGVLTGLAWMVRFQIATAALPVPFVLWYVQRQLKPALIYCGAVAGMILVAGMADLALLGSFLASFINHLQQIAGEGEIYHTPRLVYVLLLIALLVPPISLAGIYLAGKRSFWTKHLLLVTSILSFLIFHTFAASRQERYIIPILPAALLLLVLAFEQHFRTGGYFTRHRSAFRWILIPSLVINFVLLSILTFTYSHKGVVEPLVQIEKAKPGAHVLFVSPEQWRIYPWNYGGFPTINRTYVYNWQYLPVLDFWRGYFGDFDFLVLYPPDSLDLPAYLDSLALYSGPVKLWRRIPPSLLDRLLHVLNPRRNPTHEAFIYRPMARPVTRR